jgi:hypothetical protein
MVQPSTAASGGTDILVIEREPGAGLGANDSQLAANDTSRVQARRRVTARIAAAARGGDGAGMLVNNTFAPQQSPTAASRDAGFVDVDSTNVANFV